MLPPSADKEVPGPNEDQQNLKTNTQIPKNIYIYIKNQEIEPGNIKHSKLINPFYIAGNINMCMKLETFDSIL